MQDVRTWHDQMPVLLFAVKKWKWPWSRSIDRQMRNSMGYGAKIAHLWFADRRKLRTKQYESKCVTEKSIINHQLRWDHVDNSSIHGSRYRGSLTQHKGTKLNTGLIFLFFSFLKAILWNHCCQSQQYAYSSTDSIQKAQFLQAHCRPVIAVSTPRGIPVPRGWHPPKSMIAYSAESTLWAFQFHFECCNVIWMS